MYFSEKKVPDNFRAFSIKNLSAEYFLCIFRVFIKKRQIISKRGGGHFLSKRKVLADFWGYFTRKTTDYFQNRSAPFWKNSMQCKARISQIPGEITNNK